MRFHCTYINVPSLWILIPSLKFGFTIITKQQENLMLHLIQHLLTIQTNYYIYSLPIEWGKEMVPGNIRPLVVFEEAERLLGSTGARNQRCQHLHIRHKQCWRQYFFALSYKLIQWYLTRWRAVWVDLRCSIRTPEVQLELKVEGVTAVETRERKEQLLKALRQINWRLQSFLQAELHQCHSINWVQPLHLYARKLVYLVFMLCQHTPSIKYLKWI